MRDYSPSSRSEYRGNYNHGFHRGKRPGFFARSPPSPRNDRFFGGDRQKSIGPEENDSVMSPTLQKIQEELLATKEHYRILEKRILDLENQMTAAATTSEKPKEKIEDEPSQIEEMKETVLRKCRKTMRKTLRRSYDEFNEHVQNYENDVKRQLTTIHMSTYMSFYSIQVQLNNIHEKLNMKIGGEAIGVDLSQPPPPLEETSEVLMENTPKRQKITPHSSTEKHRRSFPGEATPNK